MKSPPESLSETRSWALQPCLPSLHWPSHLCPHVGVTPSSHVGVTPSSPELAMSPPVGQLHLSRPCPEILSRPRAQTLLMPMDL